MHELVTIILTIDLGTRMKSSVPTVTHKVCGNPLLSYVIDAAAQTGSGSLVLVLGHQADQIREIAPEGAICVFREHQVGTANVVMQAQDILRNKSGSVLVLCGNTPVITGETLKAAYDYHLEQNNQVTILTSQIENSFGYGRVIRNSQNRVTGIAEQKDASVEQKLIKEVNSGMVFLTIESLLMALSQSGNTGDEEEYILYKIIEKIIASGQKVDTYRVEDPTEIMAVHDRTQLDCAEHILLKRIINKHMQNGVTFHLPETCMIHAGVQIGMDTVIHQGTCLEGKTIIGKNCEIGPDSRIEDSLVGNSVYFMNSVMTQSQVGNNTKVGPFAYIRPGSKIGQNIKIGDFVEIKNSLIDDGTKVPHLSYIGDADVGKGVNIGCGAVIVNYDGKTKHRTVVGDHAFVGCNVNLVSPVVVNNYSYIAAGSTITDEVPEYALAIARSRQTVIENWVKKKGLDNK